MATVVARGDTGRSVASFTRPSNTTAYAAGDVVSTTAGAIMTFADVAKDASGAIQSAMLLSSANVSTKLDAELWLFSVAPAAVADNAVIAFTDAELAYLVDVISFPTSEWKVGIATSGADGNAVNVQRGLGIPVYTRVQNVPVNDLYGVLVARNAYVPVSAEVFTVTLFELF